MRGHECTSQLNGGKGTLGVNFGPLTASGPIAQRGAP